MVWDLRLILLVSGVLLVAALWLWGMRGRRRRSGPSGEAPAPPRGSFRNASAAPGGGASGEAGSFDDEGRAGGTMEEAPAGPPSGEASPPGGPGALPVTELQGFRAIRGELEQIDLAGLQGVAADSASVPGGRGPAASPGERPPAGERLVVVLTVIARRGEKLPGAALRDALEEQGLRYGENRLFHHHAPGGPRTAALFSVINIVQPGMFDLDTIDTMTTPGIGLFLCLPGPKDPEEAFERMIVTARRLAETLDARLCDETRSTLSVQALNHLRERIAEYGRPRRPRT